MGDLWHEERLYIDGELVDAEGGATYENINPATEEVLGVAADASVGDIDRAIAAARRAFDETGWATDVELRARCLRQLHRRCSTTSRRSGPRPSAEVGTPVALTYGPQLDAPSISCPTTPIWPRATSGARTSATPSSSAPSRTAGSRRSRSASSAPSRRGTSRIAQPREDRPALAAGNTVVLKPAPDTPWSAHAHRPLVAEYTDIPPGVLQRRHVGRPRRRRGA